MRRSMHQTVLLKETIEGLNLPKEAVVLDATFGGGGHSREILERYPDAKIIALDQDKTAWERAKGKFKGLEKRIFFVNENFRNLDTLLDFPEKNFRNCALGNKNGKDSKDFGAFALGDIGQGTHDALNLSNLSLDAIIFDLGPSSDQLEDSGRGFSFMKDEPLLMTMKANLSPEDLTAEDIVNDWSEKSLSEIIYGYGEERFARRIAKGIAEARKKKRIKMTADLTEIIGESVPSAYKHGKIHFATRTFQALRIAVNDELGALREGLQKGFGILKKPARPVGGGGRMAVISFHSLEDRIAKRFYKEAEKKGEAILINKKPITAKEEEIKSNRKSRSAKLRILEKV